MHQTRTPVLMDSSLVQIRLYHTSIRKGNYARGNNNMLCPVHPYACGEYKCTSTTTFNPRLCEGGDIQEAANLAGL